MNLRFAVLRPFVGARIIKTGIAVFIVLAAFHVMAVDYASFAAVAAILAVQPSVGRAREVFIQQVIGNLIGGVVGALLGLYAGSSPLAMALGVILVLGLCSRFGLADAANLAVVVVIFVMDRPQHDFLLYAVGRVAAISGGMLIGALVNRFIRPPRYTKRLQQELLSAGEAVEAFGRHLVASLAAPEYYLKEEIKAEAASIQRRLETCHFYLDLALEATPDTARIGALRKAVSSLFVFVERITDIHKVVLGLGGLHIGRESDLAAGALTSVLRLKQTAIEATAAGVAPRPDAAREASAALDRFEQLIEEMIDRPELRTRGLGLHTVKTNILHMRWRMESLIRLLHTEPSDRPFAPGQSERHHHGSGEGLF